MKSFLHAGCDQTDERSEIQRRSEGNHSVVIDGKLPRSAPGFPETIPETLVGPERQHVNAFVSPRDKPHVLNVASPGESC